MYVRIYLMAEVTRLYPNLCNVHYKGNVWNNYEMSQSHSKDQPSTWHMNRDRDTHNWLAARKPVFGVSVKSRLKPVSPATETIQKIEMLPVASLQIKFSKKRITKALIRLRGCAGWSAPVLFANPRRQVFSRRGPYESKKTTNKNTFSIFLSNTITTQSQEEGILSIFLVTFALTQHLLFTPAPLTKKKFMNIRHSRKNILNYSKPLNFTILYLDHRKWP